MNEQLNSQSPLDLSEDLCSEMLFSSPGVTQQDWGRAGVSRGPWPYVRPVEGTGFLCELLSSYWVAGPEGWPWLCVHYQLTHRPFRLHRTYLAPGPLTTSRGAFDGAEVLSVLSDGVTPPSSLPSPLTSHTLPESCGPVCAQETGSFPQTSLHFPICRMGPAAAMPQAGRGSSARSILQHNGESPALGASFPWRRRRVCRAPHLTQGWAHSFPVCWRRFSAGGDRGLLTLICEARNSILSFSCSECLLQRPDPVRTPDGISFLLKPI